MTQSWTYTCSLARLLAPGLSGSFFDLLPGTATRYWVRELSPPRYSRYEQRTSEKRLASIL